MNQNYPTDPAMVAYDDTSSPFPSLSTLSASRTVARYVVAKQLQMHYQFVAMHCQLHCLYILEQENKSYAK